MTSEPLAKEKRHVPIDLSGAHLLGADFRSAQLAEADLHGANLGKADFELANLPGANLSKARLTGANFRFANLRGADFSGCKLQGASLVDADASDAIFQYATLGNTDFSGATLSGASGLSWGEILGCKFSTETVFPNDLTENDLIKLLEDTNPHIVWRESYGGNFRSLIAELAAINEKSRDSSLLQVLLQMRIAADERNE